jgi:spore maturation protein CgeB
MIILCAFGKYQYGNPDRGIGTEFAAFVPALERLGHQVVHFDSWDRTRYRDYAELNEKLLETVATEKPDVMLSVQRNYEIWTETLHAIRTFHDTATVSWTTDDSWKYREVSRFIAPYYHAMTTTYPNVHPKYLADGIEHVLLTQWAANQHSMQEPLPAGSCRYKVSFVGAAHGDRKAKVTELKSHGVDVDCFGYGWPSGPVSAEQIPLIIRNSAISLNFSNSKGDNQIKARVFEIPGAGGFLLTEKAPGLDRYYDIGEQIAVFDDAQDGAKKIQYYLNHPGQRDKMAVSSYQRTVEEHSYDRRMREVIDFAITAKKKGRTQKKPNMRAFRQAVKNYYSHGRGLKTIRTALSLPAFLLYGKKRGPRFARRLIYEISWRLFGKKTYSAAGLPGRMYPEQ